MTLVVSVRSSLSPPDVDGGCVGRVHKYLAFPFHVCGVCMGVCALVYVCMHVEG